QHQLPADLYLHLHDHVLPSPHFLCGRHELRAGLLVAILRERGSLRRTLLDQHRMPGVHELAGAFRRERHAELVVLDLTRNPDDHPASPSCSDLAYPRRSRARRRAATDFASVMRPSRPASSASSKGRVTSSIPSSSGPSPRSASHTNSWIRSSVKPSEVWTTPSGSTSRAV